MANGTSKASGIEYSIVFVNDSGESGDALIFQRDPDITDPNVFTLAWFAKYVNQGTQTVFRWSTDYSFVWGETGILGSGVRFTASQTREADLSSTNQITLTYDPGNEAYDFEDQGPGTPSGTLYIEESASIPPVVTEKSVAVGIGMHDSGTFVEQAKPNKHLSFTPHPQYWIAFGTFTQGEVIDVQAITNAARVDFPTSTYSMTATLDLNNTWSINATAQANT